MYAKCVFTTASVETKFYKRIRKDLRPRVRKIGSTSPDLNTKLCILLLQMESTKRPAIDMLAELLNPLLPDAIKDISHNDHYKPRDDIVDNWTVLVEKDEKEIFVLGFAYQIKAHCEPKMGPPVCFNACKTLQVMF